MAKFTIDKKIEILKEQILEIEMLKEDKDKRLLDEISILQTKRKSELSKYDAKIKELETKVEKLEKEKRQDRLNKIAEMFDAEGIDLSDDNIVDFLKSKITKETKYIENKNGYSETDIEREET